ncbi:MAG: DUF2141 domain-containing protein [Algoriphagus sp.]|uniref:DUF2141 domain-containing protein n=1 Tax=Algoriphagus sp. TaxID=1872435 RepID=UPI0017C9A664|nr:DUF2141 domain-containing protein [Algoriphagus sp.]NVJ85298.1 DUF2141 domain-containing protein [Algoriphagus sp.]
MLLWILNSLLLIGWFSQTETSLELTITQSKSNLGLIRVLVFDQVKGYPDDPELANLALSLPITNHHAKIQLDSLPPGKYAICAFHDEDENGKLNKNLFGYPLERYGFSNNPSVGFSIPSFEKCLIEIKAGKKNKVTIDLKK